MRSLCLVFLLLLGGAAFPALGATRERTGPDSFLKWRAKTVEDFLVQYDQDPVLRKRLAKHFHVSEAELGSYLRANLRVVTIRESGWVTVYGVNSIGRIYKTRDYLHRGAPALGLADGTPLFKMPCGNPFTTELPPVKQVVQPPPLPVISEVVVEPPIVAAPEVVPPVHVPEEFVLLSDTPRAPLLVPALAEPLSEMRVVPWWMALAPVPFFDDHHHHRRPIPPLVPEPGSLLCLAAGTALLGACARRRRTDHR